MKIKRIISICKSDRTIVIFDDNGTQWLGNGAAMYLLSNMPLIEENTVFSLFDIPQKDREKFTVNRQPAPDVINLADTDPNEAVIQRVPISIEYLGYSVEPFESEIGTIYIEKRFLTPFDNADGQYELYLRYDEFGHPYIAVKSGLLILAIIQVCEAFANSEEFDDEINKLYIGTQRFRLNIV